SDEPLLIHGRVRIDGDGEERTWKVVANKVTLLSSVRSSTVNEIVLEVDSDWIEPTNVRSLREVAGRHPGGCAISIVASFPTAKAWYRLGGAVQVSTSDELLQD